MLPTEVVLFRWTFFLAPQVYGRSEDVASSTSSRLIAALVQDLSAAFFSQEVLHGERALGDARARLGALWDKHMELTEEREKARTRARGQGKANNVFFKLILPTDVFAVRTLAAGPLFVPRGVNGGQVDQTLCMFLVMWPLTAPVTRAT